jgi:hypothetical protein
VVRVPLAIGGLCLMGSEQVWWIAGTLVSFGAVSGMTGAITSPFWAEVYGVEHLGAIKAVATAVMIFASAMSPAIYGLLFDAGVTVPAVGAINIAFVVLASASAWAALRRE